VDLTSFATTYLASPSSSSEKAMDGILSPLGRCKVSLTFSHLFNCPVEFVEKESTCMKLGAVTY
jgi:hypothetical protein